MVFSLGYVVVCVLGLSVTTAIFDEKHVVQEVLRETVVEDKAGNISINETLIKTVYEDALNTVAQPAPGPVPPACLHCICEVESGCPSKPVGCHMDVGSLSCGYFQIKYAYWKDCGQLGKGWKECADDMKCASQCVQNYMARYAKKSGCPLDCETFAREHNGGPMGCKNPNTLKYWERLQKLPHCHNVQ